MWQYFWPHIVLSVLRFTASDYPFDILRLLFTSYIHGIKRQRKYS